MNRENPPLCFVFAMGVEAHPFLRKLEVKRRRTKGKAVYREAFFEGRRVLTVRCGVGPDRAAKAVRGLDERPAAIISVGTAGAIAPDLRYSNIVIASETVSAQAQREPVACPKSLVDYLRDVCVASGVESRTDRIVTSNRAVFERDERARLYHDTGAIAVDMESHAVCVEAARLGVPAGAIRVISDDMETPPLPDYRSLRTFPRNPLHVPGHLARAWQWALFLRNFRACLTILPAILVNVVRRADRWEDG